MDRQYAKAILNSIGASQAFTDKERAGIALTYRCLSLTDIYWVRQKKEKTSFDEVNLYENHLDNALVDVSLKANSLLSIMSIWKMNLQRIFLRMDVSRKHGSEKAIISSFIKTVGEKLWKMKSLQVKFVSALTASR